MKKSNGGENIPSDAPKWFKPGRNCIAWKSPDDDQGSVYYIDSLTGKMFIYEIQL
ncbi:hypothetical protein D3C86_1951440 [compost metagenome]